MKYRDRIPNIEEFKEISRAYHNTEERLRDTFERLDLDVDGDFYEWCNNNGAKSYDEDIELYLKKYTKLGKLLQGIEDV